MVWWLADDGKSWEGKAPKAISDGAMNVMIEQFSNCPSPMSGMLLEHFHGAVSRVPVEATAFPHRSPGFNLLVASEWVDPGEDGAQIAWARETYEALKPFMASGGYVNYLDDDETEDRVAFAYGVNHERLRQVKRQFDPDNLFRINQNILPA